jgi:hypothetical protein
MGRIKLYDIITESIERDMFEGFDETELTEDYPVDFDIFNFKNIRGYAAKLRYAETYLGKPIGRGSSRVVYRVDTDKVLKLAKNKKGIAQNEVEINWSGDNYYGDIMARIFDYDRDDSLWVEMELAFRSKKSDFKRLWGVDLDKMHYYLRNRYQENNGKPSYFSIEPEIKEQLDNNDYVQHLLEFVLDSDTNPGDLGRVSSWGLVKRTGGMALVLIDYGLTSDVYESYYR